MLRPPRSPFHPISLALGVLTLSLSAAPAAATVTVYGPGSDAVPVFTGLTIPPGGAADERGFAGFEYQMSGLALPDFRANDMYLIQGNDTNASQALGIELGNRDALSGVPFDFSISLNLTGGRNLTFEMTNTVTLQTSVLCWGVNCAPGSVSQELINGQGPFDAFNGLAIQIRSQDVVNSSASLHLTGLAGIGDIAGDPFYNATVIPSSPGTLSPLDLGRQGQLLMASNLEFLTQEWTLSGQVTLSRPDAATSDRTKVRLAIDLVRDPNLPFVVPEPSTALLVALGFVGIALRRRRSS